MSGFIRSWIGVPLGSHGLEDDWLIYRLESVYSGTWSLSLISLLFLAFQESFIKPLHWDAPPDITSFILLLRMLFFLLFEWMIDNGG